MLLGTKSCRAVWWGMTTSLCVCLCLVACKYTPKGMFPSDAPDKDVNQDTLHIRGTSSIEGIDVDSIYQEINALCQKNRRQFASDRFVAHFYQNNHRLLWTDWYGIKPQADTLLAKLDRVGEHGLSTRFFLVDSIRMDMARVLAFQSNSREVTDINQVIARLDYHLTRSFLRYYVGQRYGFMQPWHVFNRLDVLKEDTVRQRIISYRQLFDVDIERADSASMATLLGNMMKGGGIAPLLDSCEVRTPLYQAMQRQLSEGHIDREKRQTIVCNMERLRWRNMLPDELMSRKQVVVNIAALQLYAYSEDSVMKMKIACGSMKNKTPMLHSFLKYIQLNPTWNIPYSIIKNEVAVHAQDSAYFARNNYQIVNKESRHIEDVRSVTARMLVSGRYSVIQKGGEGNSLGRIIFRFDNNFSVYLHDTSNRQVFDRRHRTVSHGCVRVQYPYELLTYMIGEKDEWTMDKIRITVGLPPMTPRGERYMEKVEDDDHVTLISFLKIEPQVPLYITYFTVYPEENNQLKFYTDIYEYDKIMWEQLKPYCDF